MNRSDNVLPTEETGAVWQYETTHRNNDSAVECMRNSTSSWRKNLNGTDDCPKRAFSTQWPTEQ